MATHFENKFNDRAVCNYISIILLFFKVNMRFCFVIYIILLTLFKLAAVREQRPRCSHLGESVNSFQSFNEFCKMFSESYNFSFS